MAKQSRSIFKAKQPVLGTCIGAAWCLIAVLVIYFLPVPFDMANWKLFDRKMKRQASAEPVSDIVHLDVDDKSIGKIGQWPWDREKSGELVEKLHRMGAKLVVFDIFYVVPGRSQQGDEKFFAAIKEVGNLISSTPLPISDDPDVKFRNEAADKARADALYDRAWRLKVPQSVGLFHVAYIKDQLIPLVQIINNSRQIGHIRSTPDMDGVQRRIPLLVRFVAGEDHYVPSLSFAALAAAWNVTPDQIKVRPGSIEVNHGGERLTIPVDEKGRMIIRWVDPSALVSYSVGDVLDDDRPPGEQSFLKDKIVVVGVTAVGTFDRGSTPVRVDYPMSRIHSHALHSMLGGNFIREVKFFPYLVWPIVVLTVFFSFLGAKLSLKTGAIANGAVILLLVFGPDLLFSLFSLEVPTVEPLFVFVPAAAAVLIRIGTAMEVEAGRASRALERYLSPELLESIVDRDAGLDLTTKRMELTMLVVDIEGFSTISETVEVEYINQVLDEFFDRMTKAVFEQGGTVDKFLGDGLLAFFGEPVHLENHARAAIRTAVQMQREMVPLNLRWAVSGISAFEKGVRIRIGINTGLVVVGNIGSTQRMEYTVLGSAVNIASRLQALAPTGGIMLTARTKGLAKEPLEYEGPEVVRLKGIDRDIEVYKITNIPSRDDQQQPAGR